MDHNFNVADAQWYGEVFLDWEQDPVFTPVLTCGIDNTIIKAEDDCGAQYAGVLAYDPQGDAPTISWTLSHLAFHIPTDLDPPFNVRPKIYRLDGTLVFTSDMADERLSNYVAELTWEGGQGAYDDWENPLPETPGNAPKGICTYRLWAVRSMMVQAICGVGVVGLLLHTWLWRAGCARMDGPPAERADEAGAGAGAPFIAPVRPPSAMPWSGV